MNSKTKLSTYDKVDEFYDECCKKFDEVLKKIETNSFVPLYRLLGIEEYEKQRKEYFEIHGDYPPQDPKIINPKICRKMRKKYIVEITTIKLSQNELDKEHDKYLKKMNNIGISFIHEYIKLQKITNKNKKKLERETCSICCDNHKINKMITTSCGHHFGTYCFAQYIDVNYEKLNDIVCPLCRNDNLESFTKYH